MPHDRLPRAFCPLLLLSTACQAAPAAKIPPYPPLPAALVAPSAPSFVPDAHIAPLKLACAPEEPAHPNGLDDDCDGRIDGIRAEHAVLTLAAPPGLIAALRLVPLQDDGPASAQTASAARPFAGADAAPYEVLRLDLPALPAGRYAVELTSAAPPEGTSPAAAFTIAAAAETHSYGLRVEPQATARVGYLDVP